MSDEPQLVGGQSPNVVTTHGILLETTGTKETVVSGSFSGGGGGGYVDRGSGSIGPTSVTGHISSRSVDHQKVWIKKEDGSETWFRWQGRDIPLREGHRISIVSIREEGYIFPIAVVNHSSRTYSFAFDDDKWILKKIDTEKARGNSALLAGVLVIAGGIGLGLSAGEAGAVVGGILGLFFAFGIGVLVYEGEKKKLAAAHSSELDAFLNSYCKRVFQDGFPDHAFAED